MREGRRREEKCWGGEGRRKRKEEKGEKEGIGEGRRKEVGGGGGVQIWSQRKSEKACELHTWPKSGNVVYKCTRMCLCPYEAVHVSRLCCGELREHGDNEHVMGSHGFVCATCCPWHFTLISPQKKKKIL